LQGLWLCGLVVLWWSFVFAFFTYKKAGEKYKKIKEPGFRRLRDPPTMPSSWHGAGMTRIEIQGVYQAWILHGVYPALDVGFRMTIFRP
jgi:hypothetical protein